MSGEKLINVGPCCKCKTNFSLPESLYTAARNSEKITFYCPYGHPQVFREGESEANKMRRRAELAEQEIERQRQEAEHQRERAEGLERSVSAHKGQVTKLKNRAKAGVCSCCNRTFENLARHMKSKHPNMDPSEPLKVIEGGKT